ncbi:complement C1q-like protein 4 isoform X2 [Ruditapes philippinarum]|uniref:complement C1q-like protein 4 isoform X2 n=1 Tax=Ruditapes philippinarum TaxID=129788 RepID=UPI00295B1625|nr:complement C1q-like protein 4 isoform X2 [Ruditapes philippinarum]
MQITRPKILICIGDSHCSIIYTYGKTEKQTMAYGVIFFISVIFIQSLLADDNLSKEEQSKLKRYVQDLFDEKIAEEIKDLKTRLNEAEKHILSTEQKNEESGSSNLSRRYLMMGAGSPVGFMACVSPADLLNLGDKHTILFDKIITNTGGAYHNHTGVFIAPVKGLYEFQLSAMSSAGSHLYLAFVRDGTVISHIYPDAAGSSSYETAGNQWVVELNQGSEVWIQTQTGGTIHGNCFTVFSGFLISEME